MKAKLNEEEKTYNSIEEYIHEWDNIRTDLEKITEFNQL